MQVAMPAVAGSDPPHGGGDFLTERIDLGLCRSQLGPDGIEQPISLCNVTFDCRKVFWNASRHDGSAKKTTPTFPPNLEILPLILLRSCPMSLLIIFLKDLGKRAQVVRQIYYHRPRRWLN